MASVAQMLQAFTCCGPIGKIIFFQRAAGKRYGLSASQKAAQPTVVAW
jgi:hypothetical protein